MIATDGRPTIASPGGALHLDNLRRGVVQAFNDAAAKIERHGLYRGRNTDRYNDQQCVLTAIMAVTNNYSSRLRLEVLYPILGKEAGLYDDVTKYKSATSLLNWNDGLNPKHSKRTVVRTLRRAAKNAAKGSYDKLLREVIYGS